MMDHETKDFIIIILIIFSILILITFVSVKTLQPMNKEITLDRNSSMYAGLGESCITPYYKIPCKKGLKCVLISTKPYPNGICEKK